MSEKSGRACWIGAICSMIGMVGLSTAGQPHASLPAAGGIDGLGANIHFTDPKPGEMEMLAAGGFQWARMDFVWSATERERGRYDFSAYDRLLTALDAREIRALFILDYSNKLYEAERSVATEEGRAAYARWAAAAAARFQGRGILWEIWNEPNIRGFWRPEPNVGHYTAMALAAARAIREVAPDEAIVGPATSTIDMPFLEACFKAGLLEWWDAVTVHPYRQSAPETVVDEYAKLRRLIARYAPARKSVPILSGEWGYSAAWRGFDATKQGKMLPRQWLTNMAHGIPISIWYDWHDDGSDPREPEHNFGTVAHDYHGERSPVYEPKPAYLAARTLTSSLAGFSFMRKLAAGGQDDHVLLFGNGDKRQLAVWTTAAGPRTLRVPSSDCEFTVVFHTGEDRGTFSARDGFLIVTATDAPQYLLADRPNPVLANAPAAHDLRVALMPGPGKVLTVQVDNLAEAAFQGTARLLEVAGMDVVDPRQKFELRAGETGRSLRFPLAARPTGECRVGLRIENESGQVMLTAPPRRIIAPPDRLLAACEIRSDGDSNVEANLFMGEVVELSEQFDTPVMKIDYRFGAGWKFLQLVPPHADLAGIPGEPSGFGLWIRGDGRGATPRLRVRDAKGQTWQPTGQKIDWEGWRYVEFPLDDSAGHWGGADDGKVHFPIQWDSVFLLDNTSQRENGGTLHIAAPVVFYER